MKWRYLFILLFGALVSSAQERLMSGAVQDSIIKQYNISPQEKIHLHTDRTMYVPGEKIFFKAYVVDVFTHQPCTYSQYAYVELIDSSDSLIHRVMVTHDENGLFHGHIFLADLMPEGDYTLRAYTRHMENLGDDYFFKKHIRVSALNETPKPAGGRRPRPDYDVSFFPEGGNLPEGVVNRVAFKALNQQGASETVTGEIVDKEGNRLTGVTTDFAGMGSFTYLPEQGKEYFLVCKNSNGQEKRFKLPAAQKTYTIYTNYRNKRHLIQMNKSPDLPEKRFYILVHCRGVVYYFAPWVHQHEFISFANDRLPSGIIQAVLFDEQMNPVSERLFFNKNEDQATLVLSPDKPEYQKREKVSSKIQVKDMAGRPLAGHVSIAVTDDKDIDVDTLHTITASLLLSSELRGYIESPGYYLQDNEDAGTALDHLMMTHGWRRYALSDAVKGRYRLPETGFEVIKELSGTVKTLLLGKPAPNSEVMCFSSTGDMMMEKTDSTGVFRFHLHYPDSIRFYVQAKNQKGRSGVELILNPEKFPELKHAPANVPVSPYLTDFLKKAEQRARYDEDLRMINLQEITVTAKKIDKRDEARLQYPINASSDETIYREYIEKRHISNIKQLFNYIGVRVIGDSVISIRGRSPALIVIDGVPEPNFTLNMINVHDVESVDIFKGAGASLFGMIGGNGVVSITTRRGEDTGRPGNFGIHRASVAPTGFQQPVEFYAPTYETLEAKNLGLPDYRTTIFWKPDVILSDDGKASFDFYTADFPTTYSVVIEGISNDGEIIRHVETIEVR